MFATILTLLLLVALNLVVFLLFYFKSHKKLPKILLEKGDYQVVVVINKDLSMSKGKVLSQFGHAIDSLHEKLVDYPELVEEWRNSGSAKIALKGTQEDMRKIIDASKAKGLVYVRIFDAGRTQVEPGSNTVVAVGPATKKQLEDITGHLPLY
jgi:peptidyl-tRNA hydrolase, PTH2 family